MKKKTPTDILPPEYYDKIIVSDSGGKDSLACLLHVLEKTDDALLDRVRPRIELWHQDVEGENPDPIMDWPCTMDYVTATANSLNLTLVTSWRDGGFMREMNRQDETTAGVTYVRDGQRVHLPNVRGIRGTRGKFPQKTSDLSVRWCSAALKIDVAARVLANDPACQDQKILFITGERAQESGARANLLPAEVHRASTRKRVVTHWRPILHWKEDEVWRIIQRWRIRPHPAYLIGFGRVSCMACIFADKDQWASIRLLAPERFQKLVLKEEAVGVTIDRRLSLPMQADLGTEFVSAAPERWKRIALGQERFTPEMFFLPTAERWTTPPGAYKRCSGPT